VIVSIITPFHNCPELLPDYEKAVQGAQVIAIDNASDPDTASKLEAMVSRLGNGSVYVRNNENVKFGKANNQGLALADGEIVVFMNSDIKATGNWLDRVQNAKKGAFYSPTSGVRTVDDQVLRYLEGWCIFGHKSDFEMIGGWNETDFPGIYWEDNELCYRAEKAGLLLKQAILPLQHLSNYTSRRTEGAYDFSEDNKAVFERIVRQGRSQCS
jgi:GT2 family glycosyltransferase